MMNFFSRGQLALGLALLTQRMLLYVAVTDALPGAAISTAYSRIAVVLLIAAGFLLGVFLTKAAVGKPWTAGI